MLKKVRPGKNTFVVELEVESLSLLASLLHEFIGEAEDSYEKTQANLTLRNLFDQTKDCVSMQSSKHKITSTRRPHMMPTGLIVPENIGSMAWAAQLEIVGKDG